MMKKMTIFVIIGITVIVFGVFNAQGKEYKQNPDWEDRTTTEVINEFEVDTPFEGEPRVLNSLKELSEEEKELLESIKLPNLERNEKMINFGVRISTQYNQASFEFSSEDLTEREYYLKLFNLREYYYAYMTFTDSYIGEGDVLDKKKSMVEELNQIEKQMILLESSEKFERPDKLSEMERYKKFLPSMFAP